MSTHVRQMVKLPADTVKRLEELMTLSASIIERVYAAPEEDHGKGIALAHASLDLSRGWQGIWHSGDDFRADHTILRGALNIDGGEKS